MRADYRRLTPNDTLPARRLRLWCRGGRGRDPAGGLAAAGGGNDPARRLIRVEKVRVARFELHDQPVETIIEQFIGLPEQLRQRLRGRARVGAILRGPGLRRFEVINLLLQRREFGSGDPESAQHVQIVIRGRPHSAASRDDLTGAPAPQIGAREVRLGGQFVVLVHHRPGAGGPGDLPGGIQLGFEHGILLGGGPAFGGLRLGETGDEHFIPRSGPRATQTWARLIPIGCCLGQFIFFWHNPAGALPSPHQVESLRNLDRAISAAPRPIFCKAPFNYLLLKHQEHPTHVNPDALQDLRWAGLQNLARPLEEELERLINTGHFRTLVLYEHHFNALSPEARSLYLKVTNFPVATFESPSVLVLSRP